MKIPFPNTHPNCTPLSWLNENVTIRDTLSADIMMVLSNLGGGMNTKQGLQVCCEAVSQSLKSLLMSDWIALYRVDEKELVTTNAYKHTVVSCIFSIS